MISELLLAEDTKCLTDGRSYLAEGNWTSLYETIVAAPPYAAIILLGELRETAFKTKTAEHVELGALLDSCTAKAEDFEVLGRPTNEKTELGVSPSVYAIYQLSGGREALLQEEGRLEKMQSKQLFQLPPSFKGSYLQRAERHRKVEVSPNGSYYAYNDDEQRLSVFKALTNEPVVIEGKDSIDCSSFCFISDSEILALGPWYQHIRHASGGVSMQPINPAPRRTINLETGIVKDYFPEASWSIPLEWKFEASVPSANLSAITEISVRGTCGLSYEARSLLIETDTLKPILATPNVDYFRGLHRTMLSSDGQRFIQAGENNLSIWNTASKTCEREFVYNHHYDSGLKFAIDRINNLLAVVTGDHLGIVTIINLYTMKEEASLQTGGSAPVFLEDHILLRRAGRWTAYARGGRGENWQHATALRRISLKALGSLSDDEKTFVQDLSTNECWLSGAQSRWLKSLARLIECSQKIN